MFIHSQISLIDRCSHIISLFCTHVYYCNKNHNLYKVYDFYLYKLKTFFNNSHRATDKFRQLKVPPTQHNPTMKKGTSGHCTIGGGLLGIEACYLCEVFHERKI